MQLTTLIVDDEPLAREGLRTLLAEDPEVASIYEAKNGRDAVVAIGDKRPDLVFLDIQMPEMDGFSVVEEVGAEHMPAVVFVTAHDKYAIRAFEVNAIDYLLKPVTAERFSQAFLRAKARLNPKPADEASRRILALLETMASPGKYVKRLAVRSIGRTIFVNVDDIQWIRAAENYVELHTGGAIHLLHISMNTLDKCLDPEIFLRIHRSIFVNISCINELLPAGHGEFAVTLADGTRLQSGRTFHDRIKALTSNPF